MHKSITRSYSSARGGEVRNSVKRRATAFTEAPIAGGHYKQIVSGLASYGQVLVFYRRLENFIGADLTSHRRQRRYCAPHEEATPR